MASADVVPAEEAPPADERREALLEAVRTELGDAVVGSHIRPGDDLWVRVGREAWVDAGRIARDRLGCRYFNFLSAIDWLPSPFGRDMDAEVDVALAADTSKEPEPIEHGYAGGDTRFQLLARVHNVAEGFGIILKADLPDDDLSVDTWIPVYAGANWHEREVAEMFGITFTGHPNLVHLYLPSDFEGYPLRKDFPLLARRVKPWPGIVDVEPMPGDDAASEEGEGA